MVASVKIDDALTARMQDLGNRRQRSLLSIVHEAIAQYVEREEARETFKQEALDSWAEYQESGLHLTGQEVSDWLKTWGTEADQEPPECHK
jgi:predicted transcriptional regulator